MKRQTHSPLALPFEQALQPSAFLQQMTAAAENQVHDEIVAHGNAALGAAVASAKFVLESGTMQVVFEGGVPAGAKLMRAAGKVLPTLVDGKTGQILQTARVVSKGRAVATIAASSALIVVEAAHMISGYDNAKRLKSVELGVDRLLHAHDSELKARLEAIYRYSKELLYAGPEALTELDRQDLHRQCQSLMELRARWRDDFRCQLEQIDPAKPSFFEWLTRRGEAGQRASRDRKAQEAMMSLESIELMHFSLILQMALAGSAGRVEPFLRATLEDECQAWQSLADFGRKRAKEISGKAELGEFEHFLGAIEDLDQYWSRTRPQEALSGARKANQRQVRGTKARKEKTKACRQAAVRAVRKAR